MLGLTVQNFTSAAAGMATLVALIRGFTRRNANTIGNFWVDLTRSTLYILMPLSLILALVLVGQGVVQTFSPYQTVPLVETVTYEQPKLGADGVALQDANGKPVMESVEAKEQVVAVGPAASQVAIKQLGTNGGGFFNVNSAHPLENPTPLSNFLEMLAILLIPGALCYTFGMMVGDTRQGWAILAAMTLVLVALIFVAVPAGAKRQLCSGCIECRSVGNCQPARRQHGRQGDPVRNYQLRSVGGRRPRPLPMVRSMRCMIPLHLSAAWCRCG